MLYIKINNPDGIKRLCLLRYESKAFILYSDDPRLRLRLRGGFYQMLRLRLRGGFTKCCASG